MIASRIGVAVPFEGIGYALRVKEKGVLSENN
jgi:hypothetical protein